VSREYFLRRLLLVPVAVIGASLLIFFIMRVIPGDVARVILGESGVRFTEEEAEALREELGTNDSLPVQYARWLGGVLTGNLGNSLITGRPIADELVGRLPVTLELAAMAGAFAAVTGIALGILAAATRDRPWSGVINLTGIIGLAMPGFWLGTLILLLLVKQFDWLPKTTYISPRESLGQNLLQFIWPAVALGVSSMAVTMRLTRSSMLEVLRQDYVRTARAKGLRERTVVLAHVMRNALLPIVTLLGLQCGSLLGGAVVMETVFNLPGIGSLVVQGVMTRDYPLVQAVVMYLSLVYVVIWLAVDLLYSRIDPRVTLR
jgi:peptide/nickel transport system permease protein